MPTNRKRRTRKIVTTPLLDFVRIFFMENSETFHKEMTAGRENGRSGKCEAFRMAKPGIGPGTGPDSKGKFDYKKRYARAYEAWKIHRDEILKLWKSEKRAGLPWAEKFYK